MSAPTLADAIRTMARGLAYQESCVAIDYREDSWDVMTHPLANAHHRAASRLIRIAREQFEEALLVGVDLSRAEVNAVVLRARGEELAGAFEAGEELVRSLRSSLRIVLPSTPARVAAQQFERDLRGDHDSPRSYVAAGSR